MIRIFATITMSIIYWTSRTRSLTRYTIIVIIIYETRITNALSIRYIMFYIFTLSTEICTSLTL